MRLPKPLRSIQAISRNRQRPSDGKIAIFVANHRVSLLELGYPYVPLLVGAFRLEYEHEFIPALGEDDHFCDADLKRWVFDCTGQDGEFSRRNAAYCELTGLHWIWKSASGQSDVVGLMHYRRLLGIPDEHGELRPLDAAQIADALEGHDCIVAKREYFKYPIAHEYNLCHQLEDLEALRTALESEPSRYMRAFYDVMNSNSLHPYNIFVARRKTFNRYCAWLFRILNKLESAIDPFVGRNPTQVRVFGFLAERLLNIYIVANELAFNEFPVWSTSEVVLAESASRYEDICRAECYPPMDSGADELLNPISDFGFKFDHGFYVRTYDDVWKIIQDNREYAKDHAMTRGPIEKRVTSPIPGENELMNMDPSLRLKIAENESLGVSMDENAISYWIEEHGILDDGPIWLSKNKVLGETTLDGIDYSPVYDYAYYSGRYPDVPQDPFDSLEALTHFVEVGMREGRIGSAAFDVRKYIADHPELHSAFGEDLTKYYAHYMEHASDGLSGMRYAYPA